jgi:hypothetical protein
VSQGGRSKASGVRRRGRVSWRLGGGFFCHVFSGLANNYKTHPTGGGGGGGGGDQDEIFLQIGRQTPHVYLSLVVENSLGITYYFNLSEVHVPKLMNTKNKSVQR